MALQKALLDGVNCVVDDAAPTVPVTDLTADGGDVVALNASVLRDHHRYKTAEYLLAASDSTADAQFRADAVCDGTDDQVEIQAAIDALTANGGTLRLARGTYTITAKLEMKSNVWIVGEGWTTVIAGNENPAPTPWSLFEGAGIYGPSSPISDIAICNLKLDASGVRGSGYNVGFKCIFINHVDRGLFQNLWCHSSGATAIGTDHLRDVVIDGCLVTDAGAQFSSGVGANGIGIGTGSLTGGERVLISDCTVRNAGNNGIMFESQGASPVKGEYHVSNCSASGCDAGFRASGCPDLTWSNVQSYNNTDGFRVSGGIGGGPAQSRMTISGAIIQGNSGAGIKFLHNNGARHSDIAISNSITEGNGTDGVRVEDCEHVLLSGIIARNNGRAGIAALPASGGNVDDVSIVGCNCSDNGTNVGENADRRSGLWIGLAGKTVNRIRIRGCDARGQINGVRLDGTVNELTIESCDLTGNTNTIDDGSTLSGGQFRSNRGYNPQGPQSVAVGASPFAYTAGSTPEAVYINGGTVSDIAKSGTTLASESPAVVRLEPNESVTVTYSAAPTMVKDRL